ncbi:MAG: peptidase [Gemmatimonadetes bacterium]|nr:peptidase [Gemmatimonadota bacterium]
MRTPRKATTAAALLVLALGACGERPEDAVTPIPFLADALTPEQLERRVAQFATITLDFDDTLLTAPERKALRALVEASMIIDTLFLLQVSPSNLQWRARLESERGAGRDAALAYFDIMYGPWDRLKENEAFLDVGPKPPGAGYYPADLTRDEFEAWITAHPDERQALTGYFTVIRRDGERLIAVPYSEAYREPITRAAALLRQAASLVHGGDIAAEGAGQQHASFGVATGAAGQNRAPAGNESLARYLEARADALLSNDYFDSDVAWMDIAGSRIEPTIGPYEVYEDGLMGYKAAFESFITVNDPQASAELERLKAHLPELEAALPIAQRYKSTRRAFESPIRVVDAAYTAGDSRAGVQTVAFNLPNDERVRAAKGSKKVMLRNVARAKFDKILVPIANEVLTAEMAGQIIFEPWFAAVVMHELAHGLGPGFITLPSGERTTVSQALKERYAALEEAKADVTGLHSLSVLQQRGEYDEPFVRRAFIGHLADLFRAVRFGATEAHGQANLLQFNYHWQRGVIKHNSETGRFTVDLDGMIRANRELARELLTLQAEGSYQRAGEMLERHGTTIPEISAAIGRLGTLPVDIRPQYAVLERMRAW